LFGPFVRRPASQLLTRNRAPIRIGGRALAILTALIESAGEIVTKRELFSRVWPDRAP
jgi:DNA-binding winged helix-turn-helix (wHTH) protein